MFLIPWFAFFTLWAVLFRYGWGLRVSFLAAQVINGVLIVIVTETLSLFQALTFWPLAAFWSLVLLVNVILLYHLRQRPLAVLQPLRLDAVESAILTAVGFIVAVTGLIALVAPPNSFDSMAYHMARVAHWAYNGTVANYPTRKLLQLTMFPYSEYAILQGYILSRSDYLANLVQWGSMVGSLAGVSLIAGLLGGSRLVQFSAVLFAATLPMGILQSSSTQTDYVATFWAICVVVFSLQFMTTARCRWGILSALGLGLAALTKGTAVILGMPFLFWALWQVAWRLRYKAAGFLVALGIVVILNLGFFSRMLQLSPDPVKLMKFQGMAAVEEPDVRGTLSTFMRGTVTELASPVESWNDWLISTTKYIHKWLGVAVDNPRFTALQGDDFISFYAPCREDYATSLLHSLLYLLVAIAGIYGLVSRRVSRIGKRALGEGVGLTGRVGINEAGRQDILWPSVVAVMLVAVLIFCSTVKWQPWVSRFHLPFFMLFSAVAAVATSRIFTSKWPVLVLGVVMFFLALPPLFYGLERPLLSGLDLNKSTLQRSFSRGGALYRWLVRNGYVEERVFGKSGYFTDKTDDLRERLQQAFPEDFDPVWFLLINTKTYAGGIFSMPREEMYYVWFGKIIRTEALHNIEFIRQQLRINTRCRDIGYYKLFFEYEYPLWSILRSDGWTGRIEHVQVQNESAKVPYPRGEPDPCMIIVEGRKGEDFIEYSGRIYRRETQGPYQVYMDSGVAVPGENMGSLQALPDGDNEKLGNNVARPEK